METENNMNNQQTDHVHTPGHCCTCEGCGSMCMRGGMMHGMKRYWVRHFIVLILGVIAAFCVGLRLGEMKGYIMGSYGFAPMHHGWMMDRDYRGNAYYGAEPTSPAPTGTMPIKGVTPAPTTTPTGQ